MKSTLLIAGLAAAVNAMPQEIEWKAWDAAPKPVPTGPPIGGGSEIIQYDSDVAAAAAAADITASPLPQTTDAPQRRGVGNVKRAPCETQPVGAGPVPSPDTASAFLEYGDFAAQASAAPVPAGYRQTFTNLNASNSAYGYMGYTTLSSYDTTLCASKCDSITGCSAINVFFERDPSVEPADACPDPASTTNIKCVFWGGPVSQDNAQNNGQWRNQFHVVIAGSNGYVSKSIDPQAGYTGPNYLGEAAINAPLDCSGSDTYMGVKVFTDGPFDASLCAAACSAQSAYNLEHPPSDGTKPKTCQFFNTYMLLKNGIPEGQSCSMYSMAWDNSYATNTGQYRGNDKYTIAYSFTFTNTTDPGKPAIPCNVASATSTIKASSLQPYCSTLLGYTTPVTTATDTAYVTVPSATSTDIRVPLVTSVVTSVQLVAVTKVRKRSLPAATGKPCDHEHDNDLRRRDDALIANATNADGSYVDQVLAPGVVESPAALARRTAVPSPLATLSPDVVSSACSLVATPVTTISTVSTTITSTVTSGLVLVTSIAGTSTVVSTQVVTSTTTILVASSAPTGTIGYLKLSPAANGVATYALSDGATHMTDNWYRPGQRETFIVTADGYLYSVTNNAYYFLSGSPSLLYWTASKSGALPWFDSVANSDGTATVRAKKGGNAGNGYFSFCTKYTSSGDGNSGSGMHIYAIPSPGYYTNCKDMQLYIEPA